jgi:hypothetical protein
MCQKTDEGDDRWLPVLPHKPARPMKVVVDKDGCPWLCDLNVDDSSDLQAQGCWRCADVPFTRTT